MGNELNPALELCDAAVIGGGAAVLLAGIAAARAGARTVLYERMKTAARKVAISGGGRCNFGNTLNPREFVRLFGDKNSSMLGHALRAFSKDDLIRLLGSYGIEGQVERDYRLYTKSGRGADVVNALAAEFKKAGGLLLTEARILELKRSETAPGFILEGSVRGAAERHRARSVVVCTGGMSYPATGSSGDGYAWCRAFGHSVTELRPALVGLTVAEEWPRTLQGLAWPDARVELWEAEPAGARRAPLATEHAEILFTHFGVSGPAILDISNAFVGAKLRQAVLRIDFFPALKREALEKKLQERFKQFPNRSVARAMEAMMPARLLEFLERLLGPEGSVPVCRLPKAARLKLLDLLKSARLTVTGTRGIEFGEVTAGGIGWEQVSPESMQSRLVPGLFFAGEILDLAGRCGGFNLQAAFSTGYLAGQSAAAFVLGH